MTESNGQTAFPWKLWLYTNFDCNLRCRYCVAESSPDAPRRALPDDTIRRLVDEAAALGIERIFFTGGEPFLLPNIYPLLAYASARLPTTVLTNAVLLRGKRLEQLAAVNNPNLTVQVSLDGARPEQHDPWRGEGTWAATVQAIERLQTRGFHLRLSSTETPANRDHLPELHDFRRKLGLPAADHVVRPLARRGFAPTGQEVSVETLVPEVTVSVDGVFWHPLASPSSCDMRVSCRIFPLAAAVETIRAQLETITRTGQANLQTFT